jgi:tryptophanyl-tRNA synthetase
LKKTINKIVTDSVGPNDPKNPDKCIVFQLFKLFATQSEIESLTQRYLNGDIMYSEAKNLLFEKIMDEFKTHRLEYNKIINEQSYLDMVLSIGKEKLQKLLKIK